MSEERKLKIIFYFTVSYLFLFSLTALFQHNYEFLFYTVILSLFLLLIIFYHRKIHLPFSIMSGTTMIGMLHLAGGNIYINYIRLYDYWLIPNCFKFDNLVHLIATFVITIAAYSLIFPHLYKDLKHSKFLLSLIFVLLAAGLGSLNEIMELFAVAYLGAARQVGDYFNNAYDLLYNLIGAILASFVLVKYRQDN